MSMSQPDAAYREGLLAGDLFAWHTSRTEGAAGLARIRADSVAYARRPDLCTPELGRLWRTLMAGWADLIDRGLCDQPTPPDFAAWVDGLAEQVRDVAPEPVSVPLWDDEDATYARGFAAAVAAYRDPSEI